VSWRPTTAPSYRLFRGLIVALAFVLGCQALWILAAELSRPTLAGFPVNATSDAAANRNATALAASFGYIRGDLWADYALTYIDLIRCSERASANAQTSEMMGQAREIADRALAFAPYNARVWLALAGIDSRFDWINHRPLAALRMSFYTGANEIELIPSRLLLAVSAQAIADSDFQQLVRHDIRNIVIRKPDLKPAIVAAYRDALPIGQKFIEETLQEVDPALLARLRSKE
jgi:hypothetical protein